MNVPLKSPFCDPRCDTDAENVRLLVQLAYSNSFFPSPAWAQSQNLSIPPQKKTPKHCQASLEVKQTWPSEFHGKQHPKAFFLPTDIFVDILL